MLEGDFADSSAEKFPLMSMGGSAEGLVCADPVARTPICMSGIGNKLLITCFVLPLYAIQSLYYVGIGLHVFA